MNLLQSKKNREILLLFQRRIYNMKKILLHKRKRPRDCIMKKMKKK
jgi:hypothetical protein